MVGRAAAVLATGVFGAAIGGHPLAAQDDGRGWLGIRVEERYDCVWETQEDWKRCTLVMSVREMQEDGPAATSGMLIGDRLVAIDGQDITHENWPTLVSSIRSGRATRVDVLRGDDRSQIRVMPVARPQDPDTVPMVGRRVEAVAMGSPERRVFVLMLTDPVGQDRSAVALTVRDTEDFGVAVEPSAVRIVDGELRLMPLRDRAFPDLPGLRRELLDLEEATESGYQVAASALQAVGQVRARLSSSEFRRSMSRIAQTALEEAELAIRFRRSYAGAEFESVRGFSGRSGLLVLSVVRGTAAARLGLEPGDLVIRAGTRPTRDVGDLIEAVGGRGSSPVTIFWIRDGEEIRRGWPGG